MRQQRNGAKKCGTGETMWLTSYADLITAIITVLVLMVSISKVDVEKYENAMQVSREKKAVPTLVSIRDEIEKIAREQHLESIVKVKLQSDGLQISFDTAAQFETGQYTLDLQKVVPLKPIMEKIASVGAARQIDIIGHTDDTVNRAADMTNWKLASLRANALVQALFKMGLEEQGVRLIAYAQTKPVIPYEGLKGTALETARCANRRVDVLIREAKPLSR